MLRLFLRAYAALSRDGSVALTLFLFVVVLGGGLVATGRAGGLRALIDKAPGVEDEAQAAGPVFVQEEQKRQAEPTQDEIDHEMGLDDDGPTAAAPRVADAQGSGNDSSSDDTVKPVRTAIEDTCIDGTDDACKRWAMDGFYAGLGRAADGTGLARASLWGDSVTAEGYIADGIRERFEKKYDDGGAGFVFLAKLPWYQNTAVRQSQSSGWTISSIVSKGSHDHLYGYGGASFTGTSGDVATFRTAESGPGSKVSHVEVYYLAGPKGGTADVLVDGDVVTSIDSHADQTTSGFAALDVDDGDHEIQVKVTGGRLRGYGVTMERASGVVVDSLGIVSNTAKAMGKIDGAHWREQIAHRKADLMMVLLGTNESQWLSGGKAMKEYEQQWEQILSRIRKGNPDGSCMVVGTLDAGELVDGEKYVGRTSIDAMLKVERAAAKAEGCAFWDSRAYMGGKDSARKWYHKGLMSGDFEHLTKKGGHVLGAGIVEALEAGYAQRQKQR